MMFAALFALIKFTYLNPVYLFLLFVVCLSIIYKTEGSEHIKAMK